MSPRRSGWLDDALGGPAEFMFPREIQSRFRQLGTADHASPYGRIGAFADETQTTLLATEGLLRGHCL